MAILLLDLDGTLVDSAPGIAVCYNATLAALGRPRLAPDELRAQMGPPLRVTFARFLDNPADIEEAVRLYRKTYAAEGVLHARPYPGVAGFLAAARAAGHAAYVCTSKLTRFAEQVTDHFGLRAHLAGVFGAEPDGRFDDKAELMADILARAEAASAGACHVGDRREDVLAAKANGVASIGALWGYGGRTELVEAGADALCRDPGEVLATAEALCARRA